MGARRAMAGFAGAGLAVGAALAATVALAPVADAAPIVLFESSTPGAVTERTGTMQDVVRRRERAR